jgi:hypothetical protein
MILLIKGLLSYILQFTVKFFLQQTQIYLFVSFCLDVQHYPMNKSSIHGLVANPGDSKQRGLGLKLPTEQTVFHTPFIWINAWRKRGNWNVPTNMGKWTLIEVG